MGGIPNFDANAYVAAAIQETRTNPILLSACSITQIHIRWYFDPCLSRWISSNVWAICDSPIEGWHVHSCLSTLRNPPKSALLLLNQKNVVDMLGYAAYSVYIYLSIYLTSGLLPRFVGYNLLVLRVEAYRSGTQPHSLPTTKLGSRKCWSYKNGTQGQEGSHVGILIPIPLLATLDPNFYRAKMKWPDTIQNEVTGQNEKTRKT